MNKDRLNIMNKLIEIKQNAINKYTSYISITDIMIATMSKEELKEYNYLHIAYYQSCFNCGTTYDCEYCKDFDLVDVEEEQANE